MKQTPFQKSFLDSQTFSTKPSTRKTPSRQKRKYPLLWTFITTFHIFVAVTVWAGIATLSSQPETPFCYKILCKLGQNQELQVFDAKQLPENERLSSQQISQRFGAFNNTQLETLNRQLLRGYITNYEKSAAVPMLEGEFEILRARPLTENDVIPNGLVLLARCTAPDSTHIFLEYVLPTSETQVVELASLGLTPDSNTVIPLLELQRSKQAATLTNIEILPNKQMLLSAVPLRYTSPVFADQKTLPLAPPTTLNIESHFPTINPQSIVTEDSSLEAIAHSF